MRERKGAQGCLGACPMPGRCACAAGLGGLSDARPVRMRRRAANFGADALESSTQTFLELLLEQRCVWGDHLIPLAPLSHIFFEVEEEGPGRPCGGIRRVDRVRQGALLKVEDASQKLEASCLHGRLIEAFLWTQRTELISMGRSERHSESPSASPSEWHSGRHSERLSMARPPWCIEGRAS